MVDSRFPKEGATMLRDLERTSNPWGKSATERTDSLFIWINIVAFSGAGRNPFAD